MSDIYQNLKKPTSDSSSIYSSLGKKEQKYEMPDYTLPITDDESVLISNILSNSKDVENDKYALASAIFYSRQYQKPVSDILQNLDAYNEMWLNTKSTIHKNNWVSIMDAAKAGLINEELTNVAMAWQKSGGLDKAAESRLDELTKELEGLQDKVPRPWYVEAVKAGVQSAPFTLGNMAAGIAGSVSAMGGAYGLMNAYGIPVGELAGPASPAISLAIIGALGITGAYAGSISYSSPRISALEYYRMRKNGVKDSIAQPVAAISGGLQALTEVALGNVPGLLSKIGGNQAASTISGNIIKSIATKNFLGSAARSLSGYVFEGGEEALEEGVQQFTEALADIISAEIQKEGVETPTAEQIGKDIGNAIKGGFLAHLILGVPGTVIGFNANVQESKTLSKMAQRLEQKEFIRFAKEQNVSMISGLPDPQKDDILTKIWTAQQERMAEVQKEQTLTTDEQIAKAESETQPTRKTTPQAIKKLPDGRLYTADIVEQETGEDTAVGMIKAGDPTAGSGKRYGYIRYTETSDSVMVDSLKAEPGYESVKRELLLELAAKKPGKNIEWNPKSQELKDLKAQIEEQNPRGKDKGLQWFDVDQDTGAIIARQELKSKIKQWMPKLTDPQKEAAVDLLQARASAKGMKLDQYLDKYHAKDIFSSDPDVQAAQGKKGGVSFKDVEGDAKALIYVTENSDFSTWAHENAHIFRRQLEGDLKIEAEKVYGVAGSWTREQEEKFATDFEKYLYDGTAPTPKLKTLFQKIASWMKDIYKSLTGKVDVDPRIKSVFDKLLTDNKEAFQETVQQETKDISDTLFQRGLLKSAEDLLTDEAKQAIDTIPEVKGKSGELLAPNGKVSNLDARTWKLVRTKSFKEWFGDWENGKVIPQLLDENGEPKILYHGTRGEFTEFSFDKAKPGQEAIFATDNLELATFFTERWEGAGSIMPVFMSMKDALVVDWAERFGDAQFHGEQMRTVLAEATFNGKDGIVATNVIDVGILADQFVVFEPEQVKSQFNKGMFSPTDKNILFQPSGDIESTEFKEWFGNSKVVDEEGNPLVVYHGTRSEFESFSFEHGGERTNDESGYVEWSKTGFHFTTSKDYAKNQAEGGEETSGNVIPVYLSIKNPLEITDRDWTQYLSQMESGEITGESFRSGLIDYGYDGISMRVNDNNITSTHYIAFSPTQIKSVNNRGTWDKNDPRILYQEDSQIEEENLDKRYFEALKSNNLDEAQKIVDFFAKEKGYISSIDYRMSHKAPNSKSNGYDVNIIDIATKNDTIVPDDYFTSPKYYIYDNTGWESLYKIKNAISKIKNQIKENGKVVAMPEIVVYRAVPKSLKEDMFRNGDWVTPSESYAREEGANIPGGYKIIKASVKVDNLWWDANDINEWGYDDGKEYVYKNTKNNRKLADVITRTEDGEIIPPSKRFNSRNYSILYQSDEDIFREASQYSTWEEWRDMVKSMSMSEEETAQDDAWFKDMWEKANAPTMKTEEGATALDPEALDDRFVERMGDKEQIESMLSRINEVMETKFSYAAMDEEEQAQMQATADLADRLNTELTAAFVLNAARVGRGKELTPRAHKQLLTLIKQSPRDYRALYAELMNEPEYTVSDVDKTVLPEIESPKTPPPRLSITQRYALSKRIKNEEIAKKLRTGELVVDKDLQEYITSLKTESDKLKKELASAEYSISRGVQVIGAQSRKIEELKQAIKDKAKEIRTLYRVKAEHDRLKKRILKRPSSAINYEQRQQIEAIQDEIKPEIKNKSIEQLQDVVNQIKSLRDEGIFQRNVWKLQRQADTLKSREIINETILASGKYKRPPATGSEEAKRFNKKPKALLKTADLTFLNIERHAMMLDGGKEGKNWELLRKEEIKHRTNYYNNVDSREKPILTFMKKANIKIKDLAKPFFTLKETGSTFSLDATLHIWAGSQNEKSRAHIAYGNLVSEQERSALSKEEVERVGNERLDRILKAAEKIPQKYKELMNLIMEDYDKNGVRLNEFSISEFNQPIVREKNYTPSYVKDITYDSLAGTVAGDLLDLNGGKVSRLPKKGMLTARLQKINPKHQKPIELGFFSTYIKSVEMQERLMEFTPYVRKLNSVYVNGNGAQLTRSLIQGSYGSTMLSDIDNYIHEIANPSSFIQHDEISKTVRMLRGHLGAAYLGYKLSSVVKQLITSPLPYFSYVNPLELSAASLQLAAKPLETIAFVKEKSAVMRNRSFDVIKEAMKQSQKDAPGKIIGKIEDIGMKGLEFADLVSVTSGWLAVYKKTLAQTKDEAQAIERADIITLRTQPSGDPADLSPAFKTKGEAWRMFLQFKVALNVVWQNLRYDLPMMVKNRNYWQAVGTVFGYALAGIGLGMVEDGLDDDDEAKDGLQVLYWSMTQFTDSVPLLGSQFSDLVDSVVTGRKARPFSQSIYPGAEKIISGVQKVTQGEWGKAAQNFMDGIGYTIGAPVSSKNEIKRAIEKFQGNEPSEGIKTLLGKREVR